MDITSSKPGTLIGIRQLRTGSSPQYEYSEPQITLMRRGSKDWSFTFNSCSVVINLTDGPTLPTQTYMLTPFKVIEENKGVTLEILKLHKTLLDTLYPGGIGPIAQEGTAELVLKGLDKNENSFELPITVPLAFQTSPEP